MSKLEKIAKNFGKLIGGLTIAGILYGCGATINYYLPEGTGAVTVKYKGKAQVEGEIGPQGGYIHHKVGPDYQVDIDFKPAIPVPITTQAPVQPVYPKCEHQPQTYQQQPQKKQVEKPESPKPIKKASGSPEL